ncbi:hypothetical protein Tsubulata_044530 [Turnera subulata]|uniref:CCD97-like C-terminal domain-containing protein n=1 Tax=Turnera subulata TaxID=218843 RepID=A0A9Q0FAF3_9ROSI|nr:hypothetical protein Tsubulata_044530 [Turnera subulata]
MQGAMREAAKESITERLSSIDDLYFPRASLSSAATPPQRKSLLLDLLSRDASVFLERYGAQLTSDELLEFDILAGDYEVNWHLKNLRSKLSPTKAELRSRSVTVKNRRLAYLDKLIRDGKYFSEEEMRDREPYLHHEFVGKFQDQSARRMARPGERWSETLLRRAEEALLLSNESRPVQSSSEQQTMEATMSAEDMGDMMDQFTYIMHQKFLSGEDHQHFDYSKIDEDVSLDDHWLREANRDAEDKYFAEDDYDDPEEMQ